MGLKSLRILACAAAVLMPVALNAGGWVVISFKTAPTHLMAGEGTFIYTVRQHGVTSMNGLTGRVEARKGAMVVRSESRPLVSTAGVRSDGAYVVDVRFPEPGTWTVDFTAGSGLFGDTVPLTIEVLPEGKEVPAVSAVEQGKQSFQAKGCVACHAHPAFAGRAIANAVDFNGRRFTPEYVKAFLGSLQSPQPGGAAPRMMPNPQLAAHEIDSLAAFLGR